MQTDRLQQIEGPEDVCLRCAQHFTAGHVSVGTQTDCAPLISVGIQMEDEEFDFDDEHPPRPATSVHTACPLLPASDS